MEGWEAPSGGTPGARWMGFHLVQHHYRLCCAINQAELELLHCPHTAAHNPGLVWRSRLRAVHGLARRRHAAASRQCGQGHWHPWQTGWAQSVIAKGPSHREWSQDGFLRGTRNLITPASPLLTDRGVHIYRNATGLRRRPKMSQRKAGKRAPPRNRKHRVSKFRGSRPRLFNRTALSLQSRDSA